jgi:hypothetical protein
MRSVWVFKKWSNWKLGMVVQACNSVLRRLRQGGHEFEVMGKSLSHERRGKEGREKREGEGRGGKERRVKLFPKFIPLYIPTNI